MSNDAFWMRRTLQLARKGFPQATPNPLVGCVIVKNGRLVAEGWHRSFGGPHAEIEALKNAANRARGATLYVNLEPCSHEGKTPPCAPAVIHAGIKRVVAAIKDPNPKVRGRGAAILKQAGVRVEFGIMAREAEALNLPFFTSMLQKRPYIILKAAMTLDGKITDRGGRSQWITDEKTRTFSRILRSRFDAIAVGVGTVLKDNPRLTSGNGRNPFRIILDPQLRTPLNTHVLQTAVSGTAIVTSTKAPLKRIIQLSNKDVEILNINYADGFNLKHLGRLLDLKGVQTVLVEGGGETHARFIEAGFVDELLWFVAPKIVGGKTALTAVGGKGLPLPKALSFSAVTQTQIGQTLLIRATRHPQGLFWPIS